MLLATEVNPMPDTTPQNKDREQPKPNQPEQRPPITSDKTKDDAPVKDSNESPDARESRESNEKFQKLIDDTSNALNSALDGVYGSDRSRILDEIRKRSNAPRVVARASQLRAPRETILEAEAAAPFIVTGPARNVQDQKDSIAEQQAAQPK